MWHTRLGQNTLRLVITTMLGHCAVASTACAADEDKPAEGVTWQVVLCISDTQVSEVGGTECVTVIRHSSKTSLSVMNTITVKQYALREDGGPAEDSGARQSATQPSTRREQPKTAELRARAEAGVQAMLGEMPYAVLSVEGHYGPSYIRPMLVWNMGLVEGIAVAPGKAYYRGVILPSSMFQTGEYRLRAHLYQAGILLAESNIQVVRVTERAP